MMNVTEKTQVITTLGMTAEQQAAMAAEVAVIKRQTQLSAAYEQISRLDVVGQTVDLTA